MFIYLLFVFRAFYSDWIWLTDVRVCLCESLCSSRRYLARADWRHTRALRLSSLLAVFFFFFLNRSIFVIIIATFSYWFARTKRRSAARLNAMNWWFINCVNGNSSPDMTLRTDLIWSRSRIHTTDRLFFAPVPRQSRHLCWHRTQSHQLATAIEANSTVIAARTFFVHELSECH